MNDLLSPQKSTKAKVAESFLGFMQVMAYIIAFFAYIQVLADVLRAIGINEDQAGAVGWFISIGLLVLIGWAIEARKG